MFTVKGIKDKFTPLEISRHSSPKSLTGFTLLELLVVIVIVGILATLSYGQYQTSRERGIAREAFVTLRLIRAAEQVYFAENGFFYSQFGSVSWVPTINTNLRLDIPVTTATSNWTYSVTGGATFSATASRVLGPFNTCSYTITNLSNDLTFAGNCVDTSPN